MGIKNKKLHKLLLKNQKKVIYNNRFLQKGFGYIQTKEDCYLTEKQIESFRKLLVGYSERSIFIWYKLSFIFSKTQKAKESRMGKGKGGISYYIAKIKKGDIICFLNFKKPFSVKLARSIHSRLPFKVYIKNLIRKP